MIDIKEKRNCCGCSACVQRCPRLCISLNADDEGFLYPEIDRKLCINCGLCEKVCPIINQNTKTRPIKAYAGINPNEEVRQNSSSGGIFTMLAEETINAGGVVFGVSFDNNWIPRHEDIKCIGDIYKLRGSKYVQSRLDDCYKKVKLYLEAERKVLFTGTPCQIAGLKKFLGRDNSNLLTVDFICHGVPSPGVWYWYLKNAALKTNHACGTFSMSIQNGISLIKDIKFRDKSYGWRNYCFVLQKFADESKNVLSALKDDNGYMISFLNNISLRPSCYDCQAKCGKSGSDITIADFWGIENLRPDMDDDKGVSLILANSKKGKSCINGIQAILVEINIDEAISCNKSWENSACKHEMHDYFFKNFKKHETDFDTFCKELVHTTNIRKRCIRKIFRIFGYKQLPI